MKHFICTECKMTSQHAGTCQTEMCGHEGQALTPCECDDDLHKDVVSDFSTSDGENSEAPVETPEDNVLDLDN